MTTDTITVWREEIEALLRMMRMYDYDADEFHGRNVTKAWANDLESILSRATPRQVSDEDVLLDDEAAWSFFNRLKQAGALEDSDDDSTWLTVRIGHIKAALRSLPHHAVPYPALFTGTLDGKHVGLHGSVESVEALEAFIDSHHAVKVPDGWKLMPVEPTNSMVWKGCECHECVQMDSYYADAELSEYDCIAIYKAMLAATPECKECG